jgi:hypothetical protein
VVRATGRVMDAFVAHRLDKSSLCFFPEDDGIYRCHGYYDD